jgi:hypothetical protein
MTVFVSSSVVTSPTAVQPPLSFPRILYDDVWDDATITASTEDTDAEAANVADGLTWDYWRPTALPATLTATLDDPAQVDYALFAAHDFGTMEVTLTLEYYDGSWHSIAEIMPGTDRVFALLFSTVTGTAFRLTVSGDDSPEQIPSLGVLMMGQSLVMERGQILKNNPITYSRRTIVRPQVSEGGKLLGRSIRRQGVGTDLEFQYLTATWVRTYFEPFILHARTKPWGWIWQPEAYPTEVALLWTPSGKEDIQPKYNGLQTRMDVKFSVEGIIE